MKLFLSVLLILMLFASIKAQDSLKPLSFEFGYTGDIVGNVNGGIEQGVCYLGLAKAAIAFDFEKAGMWKGGTFFINAINTHGASPSADLIGDMQVASNLEAGNHTYLQELWYKQNVGDVDIVAGLQDLNVEFSAIESASLFMNSSFGVNPVISHNISAPIFPLTTLGFTLRWDMSERFSWIGAVHDGCPLSFDNNPYNLKWRFLSGDGLLFISEFHLNGDGNRIGTYKIGAYSHNHVLENTFEMHLPDSLNYMISGVYASLDQPIYSSGDKLLNLFLQLGMSSSKQSINPFYLGLGFHFSGIFSKNAKDVLGLAMASEYIKDANQFETAVELTYKYQFTDNFSAQPNVQYIINPLGTGIALPNAFVCSLRLGLEF
ncbi:MAG: carbohydrate porin [Bacteroidales bacterium]|nr:carbohydrate porin [Bacteroidales bacterium]